MSTQPTPSGELLHNLLLFGRVLRGLGLEVNAGRIVDVVESLPHIRLLHKTDFYHTLRCFLVKNKDDVPLFDEAFALFWQKPNKGELDVNLQEMLNFHGSPEPEQKERLIAPPPLQQDAPLPDEEQPDTDENDEVQEIIELTQTYSARNILREKDFGEMSGEELQAVRQLMQAFVWQMGERKTRRYEHGHGRGQLNLRRSFRHNLRYGGEFLQWQRQTRKIKPRPLVLIADISGSMERYSRLLVHFLYSLAQGLSQRVEVFVFSTQLTRITRQLAHKEADTAVADVTANVHDWSGGTRIGEAIKSFNYDWARRTLRGGAVTLLISDGWDRGDPHLLRQEMKRLHLLTHRLVWLNPLLGSTEYEPLTRGMQAALPHIDDFLPVHNLASLQDLAQHLYQLDDKRASRRHNLRGAAFIRASG